MEPCNMAFWTRTLASCFLDLADQALPFSRPAAEPNRARHVNTEASQFTIRPTAPSPEPTGSACRKSRR